MQAAELPAETHSQRQRSASLPGKAAVNQAIDAKLAKAAPAGGKLLMNRRQRRLTRKQGRSQQPQGLATALQQKFKLALHHHQAGRLTEAEPLYRQVLAAAPHHADSLQLLGVLSYQTGRAEAAVALIGQAIQIISDNPAYLYNLGIALQAQGKLDDAIARYTEALRLKPDYPDALYNLGNALQAQGKLDDAIARYTEALRLKPDYPGALNNLGTALQDQGKLDDAIARYTEALRLKPDYPDALNNLGNALQAQGKLDDAIARYTEALRLKPDYPVALNNLGNALQAQGKLDDAIARYTEALRLKPDYPDALNNLGNALKAQGKLDDAIARYTEALRLQPDYPVALYNLGNALQDQGKLDDSVARYTEALRLKPDYPDALNNLGNALKAQGKLDDAIARYTEALRLKPDYPGALNNLGTALQDQGKLDDAIARYTEALRLKPDYRDALSNLLFALNYTDTLTPESLFAEHVRLGAQFEAMSSPGDMSIRHTDWDQRLRIGYVSPDFRNHSVAYFLEPLLRAHNKNAVEVFCYAEVLRPDVITERFKSLADGWLSTVGMSAENLSRRIREDGIDILVDLAGHTANNRLSVFACKSAPVQVTWLGHPNTTGLRSIDYRLVDAVTDPEGEADALAVETLVRLTDGFLCYGPPDEAPKPAPPPCVNGAAITFGSFNNPAKLSAMTLDAWAAILRQLPNARLLLKGKSFADRVTRDLFLDRFAQRGIATKRIELMAWAPNTTSHLSAYQQVDISLDPFPFNGATTTCEALWMGVPVVTLSGDRHASRMGASILRRLNLDEFIARDPEEYIQIAVNLSDLRDRLADLRQSLRPRMTASPLCDAPAFARHIEAAYRRMWEIWCAGKPRLTQLPSGKHTGHAEAVDE